MRHMRRNGWIRMRWGILAILVGLLPVSAWGQGTASPAYEYVQTFPQQGEVNWTTGLITGKGIGVASSSATNEGQRRAQALIAAEALARRNLLAVIKGVHVDSQTTIENAMLLNDLVAGRISGFVQGAQVVDSKLMPDGAAEVIVGVKAVGPLADLLLPHQRPSPPPGAMAPTPLPTPPVAAPAPPQPEIFTGLVVDARGLNVHPAIAPKLISESGQEIYGSALVDRNWAIQQGMAGYSKDLGAAQTNTRVGDKPLMVRGIRAAGANRSDVVVSNADGAKLLSAAENLSFLEKARVMIVVD